MMNILLHLYMTAVTCDVLNRLVCVQWNISKEMARLSGPHAQNTVFGHSRRVRSVCCGSRGERHSEDCPQRLGESLCGAFCSCAFRNHAAASAPVLRTKVSQRYRTDSDGARGRIRTGLLCALCYPFPLFASLMPAAVRSNERFRGFRSNARSPVRA